MAATGVCVAPSFSPCSLSRLRTLLAAAFLRYLNPLCISKHPVLIRNVITTYAQNGRSLVHRASRSPMIINQVVESVFDLMHT
ncbi:hypothetical protein BKA82DRAFT_1004478 [Pisolithus tinctorius]|uniref:Uncharacterized protein n=1 Tax=Pisolithus tinctorius Marx 270 TaxID=870435 RepID=A0A0C3NFE6_PISTI|nr:hypothetical protein BKA82DRAFT_1004478 [Pisolithus tinctorius]KIN99769.1 hypothetical protein M404DRAFT_1004478 [Pisolithus tinctorius Marx 270]